MKTITNFWNYFQQNNFVFLLLNEISKDELKIHFEKLIEILHQYNKDLDLIIKNKTNGAELIITANGNPYLFKEVELLVHHAPVVERWKITAFLQPETNLTKYENGTDKPLELLPTKQLRFLTAKRNLKRRTKNPFRKTNRDTSSIQQRPNIS